MFWNFLTFVGIPVLLITKLTGLNETSWDKFRNWKTGFMHSYSFLRVAGVVEANCNTSNWNGLPFNSCFSLWIERNISRSPHMFSLTLVFLFLNVRLISLIYVTASLFPRGFRDKKKTNGVPKERKIWTFEKNSKTITLCSHNITFI